VTVTLIFLLSFAMPGLPSLTQDELDACRTSAHRASNLVTEANQERVNTQAINIRCLDQEWWDASFEDGHWNPGDELTWEYVYLRARNCEFCLVFGALSLNKFSCALGLIQYPVPRLKKI
jgi:hypothetical protein